MSTDSGLLEGTPYSGLQRKILQDIARKKNTFNDSMNKRTDAKEDRKKISRKIYKEDATIKNQEHEVTMENTSGTLQAAAATKKRKLSDISTPQHDNKSGNSETKLAQTRKKLSSNDSQKLKDGVPTQSSQSSSSSTNGSGSSDSKYSNDRTIYIQGLPFSATEDDVRKLFEPCGNIVSIRLPRWHDSGRIKGYGHVEFQGSSSAAKALDLSGEYINDRYITVDRPQTPRSIQAQESGKVVVEKPVGCRRIFVKNLPYEVKEEEIREAFKVFGPITNIRLAMWGHTGNLKGGLTTYCVV